MTFRENDIDSIVPFSTLNLSSYIVAIIFSHIKIKRDAGNKSVKLVNGMIESMLLCQFTRVCAEKEQAFIYKSITTPTVTFPHKLVDSDGDST